MGQASEHRSKPNFFDIDFEKAPFIAIWEITRACDLRCVHCRAEAIPQRDPEELTREQGFALIDELRRFSESAPPLFVITGGDPLKSPYVYDYIRHADQAGLRVAVTPSATGLLTRDAIHRMKEAGLTRMAISLDGSTAEIHDNFRRQPGSYDHTIRAIKDALTEGLTVQINTTISRWNMNDIDALCELMQKLGLTLWAAFFLVPTGRGEEKDEISPQQYEVALQKLYETARKADFDLKTTAAPHYRRIVLQAQRSEGRSADSGTYMRPRQGGGTAADRKPEGGPPAWVLRPMKPGGWARGDASGRAGRGVNDGNGFIFVDHQGYVYPSGFLPLRCGNVKRESIVKIYRENQHLKRMRDFAQLKGKCWACDYRDVCGGARSRAFAVTGDYTASEPYCVYVPPALAHVQGVDWLAPDMLLKDVREYLKPEDLAALERPAAPTGD
ncbi:MAG: TIGR04053 family radical SAM/SPASM domain-containing protein [Planctomycetes bacterium]|nr:TIGR04053 family radical SAM/SPASM domain-containing protein [Planctomycetota bacterium]